MTSTDTIYTREQLTAGQVKIVDFFLANTGWQVCEGYAGSSDYMECSVRVTAKMGQWIAKEDFLKSDNCFSPRIRRVQVGSHVVTFSSDGERYYASYDCS